MRPYRQLTQLQQCQIQVCEEAGLSQTDIALQIGCHRSTINRGLERCKAGRYNAEVSHKSAIKIRRSADKAARFNPVLWLRSIGQLARDWSPAVIAGRIALESGR